MYVYRPSEMVAHPASPTIDHHLKPLIVTEGETAKFMVKVRGEPTPDVTWLVNDVAVYNVSLTACLLCSLLGDYDKIKTDGSFNILIFN